jgi:hypothetical protein
MTRGRRLLAGVRIACLMASCMMLAACSGGDTSKATAPPSATPAASHAPEAPDAFTSKAWGFRIDAPPGWTLRHDFQSSYLTNGAWKTFAAPDSRGTPVLSLTMPGSNRITDAEIRIGASRDAGEARDCTTPPSAVVASSVATERINGITFTTFEAGDAAMSHHLRVHAYRTLRDGTCYAIDLLVFGVNPRVYDPPATPPFPDAHAFEAMRAVFRSFAFTQPAGQSAAKASTAAQ